MQKEGVVSRSHIRHFQSGSTILKEGDDNANMYFIVQGSVRLLKLASIPEARAMSRGISTSNSKGPKRAIETAPNLQGFARRGKTPGGGKLPSLATRPNTTGIGILPKLSTRPSTSGLGLLQKTSTRPGTRGIGLLPKQSTRLSTREMGLLPKLELDQEPSTSNRADGDSGTSSLNSLKPATARFVDPPTEEGKPPSENQRLFRFNELNAGRVFPVLIHPYNVLLHNSHPDGLSRASGDERNRLPPLRSEGQRSSESSDDFASPKHFELQSRYARGELRPTFPVTSSVFVPIGVPIVKCLVISRVDIARVMVKSPEIVKRLHQEALRDCWVSVATLQERYQKNVVWKRFKKRVLRTYGNINI